MLEVVLLVAVWVVAIPVGVVGVLYFWPRRKPQRRRR